MKGSLGIEDVFQQLAAHGGLECRAGGDHVGQVRVPLEHRQGAHLILRHFVIGGHGLLNGLFQLRFRHVIAEEPGDGDAVVAHLLQEPPDLRLEEDHKSQEVQLHRLAQQEVDGVEVELIGQPQGHHKDQQSLGRLGGVGPLDQADDLVDHIGQDGDVDDVRKGDQPQIFHGGLKILQNRRHRLHLPGRKWVCLYLLMAIQVIIYDFSPGRKPYFGDCRGN